MLLSNVRLVHSNQVINIEIQGGLISNLSKAESVPDGAIDQYMRFDKAIAFPGLINSHDHLDFNLFPQLGTTLYKNYMEWATYIHKNHKKEINAVLRVPEDVRVKWGVFKNLLCGVTTVVNHGKKLNIKDPPIRIYQHNESLHSVAFEKNWKRKLNNLFTRHKLVSIHTGEGIDALAYNEIDQLIKGNIAKRKIMGVHGVAMLPQQAKHFRSLVWCPASNYFLFHQTANIRALKSHVPICFGSDSTLTSEWNMWEHLRLARRTNQASDEELLNMATVNPASILKLNCGKIEVGKDADLVIANDKCKGIEAFFAVNPSDILLVVHKGKISLVDKSVIQQTNGNALNEYSIIEIDNTIKYVKGNLTDVIAAVRQFYSLASIPCKPVLSHHVYQ